MTDENTAKPAEAPAPIAAAALVGKRAPTFSLPSSDGGAVSLADLGGKTVVLYFYPRADTPGCTVQACGFRDSLEGYRKRGIVVLGVSPDPIADVARFAEKFHLNFPLLADEDHSVCERYGVWVQKSMNGTAYMGAARTTFVITDGTVTRVFEKVRPEGHEQEVLAAIP